VYNEIPREPTVVVVPVFDTEPDAGFGVNPGDGWAAPGLVTSLRKSRLNDRRRRIDVQALTDVNNIQDPCDTGTVAAVEMPDRCEARCDHRTAGPPRGSVQ
jgi:hypothetical protein